MDYSVPLSLLAPRLREWSFLAVIDPVSFLWLKSNPDTYSSFRCHLLSFGCRRPEFPRSLQDGWLQGILLLLQQSGIVARFRWKFWFIEGSRMEYLNLPVSNNFIIIYLSIYIYIIHWAISIKNRFVNVLYSFEIIICLLSIRIY